MYLRQSGFEPRIIREDKQHERTRKSLFKQTSVIEKAKGVDIGLSVRILEDAHRGNFDVCYLVTSDVDFLPLIESVGRMGKHVCVLGYAAGIAADSPFHHVPDRFANIGDWMKRHYRLVPRK